MHNIVQFFIGRWIYIMKKVLKTMVSTIVGAVAGAIAVFKVQEGFLVKKDEKINKFKAYYNVLNQWLIVKQNGKNLYQYFEKNSYKTVAIYGMGELGNRLYDELKDTDIEVKYVVDQNADTTYSEVEVLGKEDALEEVDVMVVTAIFAYDKIERDMRKKISAPIISLNDVVYDL